MESQQELCRLCLKYTTDGVMIFKQVGDKSYSELVEQEFCIEVDSDQC